MEFTIKRKKWLRGQLDSALLHISTSKMCCLGIYAKACGYKPKEIRGVPTLADLSNVKSGVEKFTDENGANNYLASNLMSVNDHEICCDKDNSVILERKNGTPYIVTVDSEEKREALIKKLFDKAKIQVTFE